MAAGGAIPRTWLQRRDVLVRLAAAGHIAVIPEIEAFSTDADAALARQELSDEQWSQLKFTCSSLLINLGSHGPHREAVVLGIDKAREVVESTRPPQIMGDLLYNIANGLLALHEIDLVTWGAEHAEQPPTLFTIHDRATIREARALFSAVGYSGAPAQLRASALCNLGNALDHSGRWIEAYQAYVDALEADPSNGNAAGNAAELLRLRIVRGRGLPGHYAAVYDRYREQAQRHRERTVELAGQEVARRWDDLPVGDSQGHISHDGDPLDPYQQWIKDNRLALTAAVEGLGSDEPRWDSAMVEAVTVRPGVPDPPPVFASMNVLKAEYLVARRLAYDGERLLNESPFAQHPTDTGTYADTLDMSLYGEPPAQLILAQRATLDLLDKIAVAANDHFTCGVAPTGVKFATFWRAHQSDDLRAGLPIPQHAASAAVALSELAFDMDPAGLYPEAKTLRNAGTHRIVRLTHDKPTGVTTLTHSSIDMATLIRATHQSLRVARAAYIYLIDLVQDREDESGADVALPLPMQT